MRKVALVFVLAVFVPSLVLAWLAVRSLRDQQFLLERQQSLLYQGVADSLAKAVQEALAEHEHTFAAKVTALVSERIPREAAVAFDDWLRKEWPLAQVGFVVSSKGEVLSPSPQEGPDARNFLEANGRFLANRESAEVYWNPKQVALAPSAATPPQAGSINPTEANAQLEQSAANNLKQQFRNVVPQQQSRYFQKSLLSEETQQQQLSKVAAAECEFRQLIGEDTDGTLARFVDNKLNLLFWDRPTLSTPSPTAKGGQKAGASQRPADSDLIFGALLSLPRLAQSLRSVVTQAPGPVLDETCVALLDDNAKPVVLSRPGFQANWKHPFVATEIGEVLPHWEIGLYLLNPAKLTESAHTIKLTLGLLIGVLVLAIGVGSWLIVADLSRQLTLARQKTDFVSNVSHELKTPLTSIRMFSELLAEGRVTDPAKQRSYLGIVTAEAARLTRLINNVLDFARIERGEKKYHFHPCDLVSVARETAESYRPHLEENGFRFQSQLPEEPVRVNGDRDALAQVIVNLLSNAEKYSEGRKEISLCLERAAGPLPCVELKVLDRGPGVPRGSEEKIFEQFYRIHDSLSSGIQGSGLGLTLARQIARAHGGEVLYSPREGGGSCFSLRLPLEPTTGRSADDRRSA